ncbi:hypothetical protein POM88_030190 [Heracleum sosnowskyi]|uniref:Uncharacterized protein n=1 Tax=Heracleum sosnowskyi TaxID=360622 RepID=A0AAD8MIE4_9APIA|nr:hypothetical protein POM88_030190 [Heracleum sosnowskyi]
MEDPGMLGYDSIDRRLERNKRRREQYNKVTNEARYERNKKRPERRRQLKEASMEIGVTTHNHSRVDSSTLIDEQRNARNKRRRDQRAEEKRILQLSMEKGLLEFNQQQITSSNRCLGTLTDEKRIARNKRRREQRAQNKKSKQQTDEQKNVLNKCRREQRAQKKETALQYKDVSTKSIQMIRKQTFRTKAFAEVSTRTRNTINAKKLEFGTSNSILDIGFPGEECFHCGAIMWKYERTKQQERTNSWGGFTML